jgi:hypothetical protein
LLAEPQVAVEVLAGRCAASVVTEVLAGIAASGCLGTCWQMCCKWQMECLLVGGPQVADEVLAGIGVARGGWSTCW